MNGNSQAVRIPQEFRLDTDRVEISRNDQGDLVIHPLPAQSSARRGDELMAVLAGFEQSFVQELEAEYNARPLMQDREEL